MFDDQQKFLDGQTRKTKLTKADQSVVNALSNSNTEVVEVGDSRIGKVGTVVIPSLTKELIESGAFPFFRSLDDHYYDGTSYWVLVMKMSFHKFKKKDITKLTYTCRLMVLAL
jgi:hypothetical protein